MENSNFILALTLTIIAGLSTGLGGAIIIFTKKLSNKFLAASLGFSAGVMIFISLVEIFSEAQGSMVALYGEKMGYLYTLLAFFGGMGIIALIDNLVPSGENPHEMNTISLESSGNKNLMRLGVFSAIAIAIHNFPEGMATFVSTMENPQAGISIAIAVAIHNIPEGIAVAIPIYYATNSRGKAIGNSFLSGVAEPVGGLLGYFILAAIFKESFLGIILAAVAGIMVYISLDELLPTAEKYGKHHVAIIGVIAGMAFMGFSLLFF
ncbi:MAG: zinc transporter ZupT [Bacteroidales bacterium]|nr:zinc transporter ZupT [Bacteroidales bacterium]